MSVEVFSLPPREAIRYVAGQVNIPTARYDDVWKGGHTRGFMVAGVQADDLLASLRAARDKAVRDGTTLAEFRRDLGPLLARLGWDAKGKGYVAWRTRLIYETNLRSAYAAGQYEQQTDPDVLALLPVWRYRHSGAKKDPRPEHQRWDGLTLAHDDAWWRSHYPPNGWGCGCWVEPLTQAQADSEGGLGAAPPIIRRPWRDPVSGRTDMVPIGIDPGWDYNVGAAWREARDLPGSTYPLPAEGWPPPVLPLPAATTPRQLPALPKPSPPAAPAQPPPAAPEQPAPAAPAQPPPAAPEQPSPAAPRRREQPARVRTEVKRAEAAASTLRADRQLAQDYAAWGATLSPAEREAIGVWRSSAGLAINLALRGRIEPDPGMRATIDALSAAIGRATAPRDLVVHRGAAAAEIAALAAEGEGAVLPAFLSTSLDRVIARDFARRHGGRVIEVRIAAGTRGVAYVQPFPRRRPLQYEVLLAPGLGYRVVSRGKRVIVVEIVDVGPSSRAG